MKIQYKAYGMAGLFKTGVINAKNTRSISRLKDRVDLEYGRCCSYSYTIDGTQYSEWELIGLLLKRA